MRVRAVLASVRSGSPVDASLSAGGGSGATDAVVKEGGVTCIEFNDKSESIRLCILGRGFEHKRLGRWFVLCMYYLRTTRAAWRKAAGSRRCLTSQREKRTDERGGGRWQIRTNGNYHAHNNF